MSRAPTILALAAYPEGSAATRFRMTQLVPFFEARGWEVRFDPFLDAEVFEHFYTPGKRLNKASQVASRSLARLRLATTAMGVDAVFVQREASLVGPAFTEHILSSLRRLPLVFDFDDAIWQSDLPRSAHPLAARLLKRPSKCWSNMRSATLTLAGSNYLAERARRVSRRVEVVPTVVSSKVWTPEPGRLDGVPSVGRPLRIGWVGSHSTAHQLDLVAPALHRLRNEGYSFELDVVGAPDGFALDGLELRRRPWRLERELSDFRRIDIGLAPMHSAPIYQGKCGFKQLQYMAVGVPFVSSWVGGAKEFVVDGKNGLVAHEDMDWYRHLKGLLDSPELRTSLGRSGRALVENHYCIERVGPRVVSYFERILGDARAS
jgi:glycosyltransferase involved in cell wall biosynthesis